MATEATSDLVVSHPGAGSLPSETNDDNYVRGADDDQQELNRGLYPSKLPKEKLFGVIQGWHKADASHSQEWRDWAKTWYDFRAGDQWNSEDRQVLNAQSRPEIVFNRVLTILKAVAGMEINGRHEVHFIPRHNADTAVNELLTGASKWMGDECDAEDEESQAFEDVCTCGMGWTEHRLDYELDPQGLYIEEKTDPLEMYWDRAARKKNLSDSRRRGRLRKMPLYDAMQMFPGKTREQLDAAWAAGTEWDNARKTLEEKRKREENTTDSTFDDTFEVTILNEQWIERQVYWIIADPQTNTKSELSDDQYKQFSRQAKIFGIQFVAARMTRRVYMEAFVGGEVLSVGKAAVEGQWKWTCITGELHRNKGVFFGLVKIMEDPQRWANKWLSQSLHILNTTAKGGIVAEQDAFEDIRDVEDKWARQDTIVWTKRGALSGDKPKIMPRPGQGFPQGHIQLMEFAISAIRDVTGVNLELLGLRDQNQPGILEAQRKQAGMTVLATMFDALRKFRKEVGRIRLYIIQTFLSDDRLIRITAPDTPTGFKSVPLMKDKTVGQYNVIVSDAPTSPNQKEQNWAVISTMLPIFKDQLVQNPELLILILEYSPLPSKIIDSLKQVAAKMAPQQQKQQQLQEAGATAKIMETQANAELKLAQAGKQQSTALYDIAIAMAEFTRAHREGDLTAAKAQHERVKAAVDALTPIEHGPQSEMQAGLGPGGPTAGVGPQSPAQPATQ